MSESLFLLNALVPDVMSALVPASFRGVEFWMIDSANTVGRRVQKFLFPGQNIPLFEDLGAIDGPFEINGILVGDDYVAQSMNMRAALRTRGRATLFHPWLGELHVILTSPGSISFDAANLRVVKIKLLVELFRPHQPAPIDTLSVVVVAITVLQTDANGLIGAILAPISTALTVAGEIVGTTLIAVAVVQSVCASVAGIFYAVASTIGAIAAIAAAPIAALEDIDGFVIGTLSYAAEIGAAIAAPAIAIAGSSATLLPSAIGPGDQATLPTPQSPRDTAAILLNATGQIVALATSTAPAPTGAVVLTAASLTLASAIDAATDIVFTSQEDAQNWLGRQLAAIELVANLAVQIAPLMPAAAGTVWRDIQYLQNTVCADINARLGRLPAVQTITLIGSIPAWLVAQALVGDSPGLVLAMYNDLVTRNNVANPQVMGPGPIEVLVA